MAIGCGGYRRTWADVSSDQLVKWPALMAVHQVESAKQGGVVKSNAFCQVGVIDDGIGSAGCAGNLGGVSIGRWRC